MFSSNVKHTRILMRPISIRIWALHNFKLLIVFIFRFFFDCVENCAFHFLILFFVDFENLFDSHDFFQRHCLCASLSTPDLFSSVHGCLLFRLCVWFFFFFCCFLSVVFREWWACFSHGNTQFTEWWWNKKKKRKLCVLLLELDKVEENLLQSKR